MKTFSFMNYNGIELNFTRIFSIQESITYPPTGK